EPERAAVPPRFAPHLADAAKQIDHAHVNLQETHGDIRADRGRGRHMLAATPCEPAIDRKRPTRRAEHQIHRDEGVDLIEAKERASTRREYKGAAPRRRCESTPACTARRE